MRDQIRTSPHTRIDPVTEVIHGVAITDPYRWLERSHSLETREWLEAQANHTRAFIKSIRGREAIKRRVEELLSVEVKSEPWKFGNRVIFLKRGAKQEQPVIAMREGGSNDDCVLVNPCDRGEGSSVSVRILQVSGDGNLLAYAVRQGGEDLFRIECFDIEHRCLLPDCLPRGLYRGLAFSFDRKGFYYAHEKFGAACRRERTVYWHSFGTSAADDMQIFSADDDDKSFLNLLSSMDGRYLGYLVRKMGDDTVTNVYVQDIAKGTPPYRVIHDFRGAFYPQFAGDTLLALADWRASHCVIISCSLNDVVSPTWRVLVPELGSRIQSFKVAGGLVFVCCLDHLQTRVELFDLSGSRRGSLPSPPDSTIDFASHQQDSDCLFYECSSFVKPPEVFCYNPKDGTQRLWSGTPSPSGSSAIDVRQIRYPSKDGTQVPMFLASQNGRQFESSLPTLLTAYGGFGSATTPKYSVFCTVLIEKGFLYAVANVRGGSELGSQWHRAGMRENRQNTIDDFLAAAEWLQHEGYAATGRFAIAGGSSGGLLVGAAVTQRPELFRAAVCVGPLLDMLRYHKFDVAQRYVREYGSSEDPHAFTYLRSISPYHRVVEGECYPAVLFVSGDADNRCNPLHVRKMTARLQAASRSGNPILLDYRPHWGHSPAQPLSTRIEALADRLSFLCHELGVCA
jgi:prolyl oligopeptidase